MSEQNYDNIPIFMISSPNIWDTMIYKNLDKALIKTRDIIINTSNSVDEPSVTITYVPKGRIVKGFNEDTQSVEGSEESSVPIPSMVMRMVDELSNGPLSESIGVAYRMFGEDALNQILIAGCKEIMSMHAMGEDAEMTEE